MGLSRDEARQLRNIDRSLREADPDLARAMARLGRALRAEHLFAHAGLCTPATMRSALALPVRAVAAIGAHARAACGAMLGNVARPARTRRALRLSTLRRGEARPPGPSPLPPDPVRPPGPSPLPPDPPPSVSPG